MKRVVAAAGACAIGSAGLHGANVIGLTPQEQSKWWILSGSVSSFYDDNTFNRPDARVPVVTSIPPPPGRTNYASRTDLVSQVEGSFGIQLKPGVAINLPSAQTLLSLSYDYTLDFYENRPSQKIDQTHWFDFLINHRFSERRYVEAKDTFVISDQPGVTSKTVTEFARSDASSTRNEATIEYSALMTPVFGVLAGYGNNFQDYDSEIYSRSYDRTENSAHVDARWYLSENTLGFVGYRIGYIDYSAPTYTVTVAEVIPQRPLPVLRDVTVHPTIKNNVSHSIFVGTEREFSGRLKARGYVGAQLADYYELNKTTISPYADATITYTYRRGCELVFNANVGRFAADTSVTDEENVTLDQLVYTSILSINHRLTSHVSCNASLQYQHSTFNGGPEQGTSDDYFAISIGSQYKIREYLWFTASYSYNRLASGRPGNQFISYDKNYISLGVRATY